MNKKELDREEAVELRKKGKSVGEIANLLHISKSSASIWVRHVELTDDQKTKLSEQNPFNSGHSIEIRKRRNDAIKKSWENKRMNFQQMGEQDAAKGNHLHMQGCMLYWGEGTKRRNACIMINTDPDLLKHFIRFLIECYDISPNDIKFVVKSFKDHNISSEDTALYWSDTLGLPLSSLTRIDMDWDKKDVKKKKNVHKYGLCQVYVCRTDIVQRIFGAIKYYAGIQNLDKWIG